MAYGTVISQAELPIYNSYGLELTAIYDLEPYEELFSPYGVGYWSRPTFYSKFHSGYILTGDTCNAALDRADKEAQADKDAQEDATVLNV